jgi:hypothetical protein
VNFGHLPGKATIKSAIIRGGIPSNLNSFKCIDPVREGNAIFPGSPLKIDEWASSRMYPKIDGTDSIDSSRYLDVCVTYSGIGGNDSSRSYHTKLRFHGVAKKWQPVEVEGSKYFPIDNFELSQTMAD